MISLGQCRFTSSVVDEGREGAGQVGGERSDGHQLRKAPPSTGIPVEGECGSQNPRSSRGQPQAARWWGPGTREQKHGICSQPPHVWSGMVCGEGLGRLGGVLLGGCQERSPRGPGSRKPYPSHKPFVQGVVLFFNLYVIL